MGHLHLHGCLRVRRSALVLLLISTLLIAHSSATAYTEKPSQTIGSRAPTGNSSINPAKTDMSDVLLLLSHEVAINRLIEAAVNTELQDFNVQLMALHEASDVEFSWPPSDIVITVGKEGCELARKSLLQSEILCTLLTEEGFHSVSATINGADRAHVSALVIDQPVARQAQVAQRVYPALRRFSVFSYSGKNRATGDNTPAQANAPDITEYTYDAELNLPVQLRRALTEIDALIATADSNIYNSSTLSTILLTAYGYGKPLVGFSRSYVTAGALLSCYSTPLQIMQQVARLLRTGILSSTSPGEVAYPDLFSVVVNNSVAKSLGLFGTELPVPNKTYTDADFWP